jgi:hypothetical protein
MFRTPCYDDGAHPVVHRVLRTTSRNTGAIGVDKIAIVTNAVGAAADQVKRCKGLEASGLFGCRVGLISPVSLMARPFEIGRV